MKFHSLLLSLCFAVLVSAAPILTPRATLLVPSDDPFYLPPDGFEDQPLGTILRTRKVTDPFGLWRFQANVESIYQILVVSEDTFSDKIAVVTTIFAPHNADPSKLVSYHMAEDTASPNCAPSYAMQLESSPLSWITPQVEVLLFSAALNEGYYVSVPDHEGPKATFVAGYLAAYAVLNTVKAVLATGNDTGINSDAEVAFWGYSGGGFTTAWAASLQPTYASEINLVGAAMGGVPVDLHHVANYTMGTIFAGFIISAVLGLSHEYPELASLVVDIIDPERYPELESAQNDCLVEILTYYAFANWEMFTDLGNGVLDLPLVKNVTGENSIMNNGGIPTVPILAYHSQMDEIIPVDDMDDLYDFWCAKGVNLEYHRDLYSGHIITAVSGAGLAWNFIKDRFNKVPINSQCQKTTVALDLFDSGSLLGLGEIAAADLALIFNDTLGPEKLITGNTTSSTPSGSTGFIATILNGALSLISSLINPENPESVTEQEIYNNLGSVIRGAVGAVTTATGLITGLFGGLDSSNGTLSGLISSVLSEGTSLASDLLGLDSSSNTTSLDSGILSTLLSSGASLATSLFDSSSNSTSLGGGLISTLLSSGGSLLSSLLSLS